MFVLILNNSNNSHQILTLFFKAITTDIGDPKCENGFAVGFLFTKKFAIYIYFCCSLDDGKLPGESYFKQLYRTVV